MPVQKPAKNQDSRKVKPSSRQSSPKTSTAFPIVAIGASAGGLEAFEAFFNEMPDKTGIAFILVAHLDPTHSSLLPELIQKHSTMHVQQITDGIQVLPNQIYVIPPNKNLQINNSVLQLSAITLPRGSNLPIDSFFRSLAADQGKMAIGIILSGTGSDGTLGVKAIKAETGMVMVQQEDSARYDGMPRSAIATGLADYILPAEKMPAQLTRYTSHAFRGPASNTVMTQSNVTDALKNIYAILHVQTDQDFSLYKKNTICRRIERRMNVHQMEDIQDYVQYLKGSEREVKILFKELLIGVTNFFRDPAAFEVLKQKVLVDLLAKKPEDYTIRIWVTGCSSGEEAYSLAIILQEFMLEHNSHFNVQIFGTDIDEDAINSARAGLYPESIQTDVSAERLKNYFIKDESGQYRVKKVIREMLVFAIQNIIKDPPFTKLDFLSCRNLLIYLGPELQQKLLPVFHYSLKPDGVLFLGSSESVGQSSSLFFPLDKKWKLFSKKFKESSYRPVMVYPPSPVSLNAKNLDMPVSIRDVEEISALQLVETILQQSDTPPCAIIDDDNNVVYIHGRTGMFLEPAEGRISVNILEMARTGLKSALMMAIRKVAIHKQEVITRDLKIESENGHLFLDITVKPILELSFMRGHMMVIFEEKKQPSKIDSSETINQQARLKTRSVQEIERELIQTRENLQSTIEELETSNEELKSTNEELQSTNEELQSTNEEMETSKEELQSLNEESATVNAELQSKIDELSESNDDMKNLLDSTHIATIFLDTNMCIRRFTPQAQEIIPLTPTDIGRPLKHLSTSLVDTDISKSGNKVLKDLIPLEVEVSSGDERHYLMRVRAYRTTSNVIDGVVITFEDITESKFIKMALEDSEARYRMLFELSSDSVVLIDIDSARFIECNKNAYSRLGYTRDEFLKLKLPDIESKQNSTEIMAHFNDIVKTGSDSFFTQHRSKNGDIENAQVKTKVININDKKYLISVWTKES